jgi:RNase P protein component
MGSVDCVVVVRREATAWSFQELAARLERCLRQLLVLTDAPPHAAPTAGGPVR